MKITLILAFLFLTMPAFGQMITNDDLEKKYGMVQSSETSSFPDGEKCSVINFNAYDETNTTTTPSYVTNLGKTGIITGGQIVQSKTTYLTMTIRNNTDSIKRISTSDVTVMTAKGSSVSPRGEQTFYLNPGETKTITGLKFSPGISQVVSVQCACY